MPTTRERSTYPHKRRLYHAAFFWISQGNQQHPVNMNEVTKFLETLTLNKRDVPAAKQLLASAAKYAIRQIRNDVRNGVIGAKPLSRLTRRKKGHGAPFIDSGQMLESLVARPPVARQGGRDIMGFNITADTSVSNRALHHPNYPRGSYINMVQLWNIVTHTGAFIDLSNDSVRKRIFGFYRALGLLDEDFPKRKTGKSFIYIPPRPIFTEAYLQDLSQRVWENVVKPTLGRLYDVFSKAMEYGPVAPGSYQSWLIQKWNTLQKSREAVEELD